MVIGTLRFLPPPHRRLKVLEILRRIQGPVLADPGCAGFHIYEEQGPSPAVVLVERWESKVALEKHMRSDTFRDILTALESLGHDAGGPIRPCIGKRGHGTDRARGDRRR